MIAEVIFPTFALQACFASEDAELQRRCAGRTTTGRPRCSTTTGCCRSAWCRCSTSTAPSTRRSAVADQGFRALFLPARVPSRPYNDGAYDPFWAVAEDIGLPLTFHSGTGHEPRVVRGPGRRGHQLPHGRAARRADGDPHARRRRRARPVPRAAGRHRRDRRGVAGWIMTQADAIYEDHNMFAKPEAVAQAERADPPAVLATFMYDPVAINNRAITGIETLMWGNDYPHPEGTWPESQDGQRRPVRRRARRRRRRHRRRQRRPGLRLRPRPASRSSNPSPPDQLHSAWLVRGHPARATPVRWSGCGGDDLGAVALEALDGVVDAVAGHADAVPGHAERGHGLDAVEVRGGGVAVVGRDRAARW